MSYVSKPENWDEIFDLFSSEDLIIQIEKYRHLLTPSEIQLQCAQKEGKWTQGFEGWDREQNNPHHNLSVWKHTLKSLEYLQGHISNKSIEDKVVLNISMTFHDIGKCDRCSIQEDPRGYLTYHEHELSSADIVRKMLFDFNAPQQIQDRICRLVRNHMRLHTLPNDISLSGLRRIARKMEEDWEMLILISQADCMGRIDAQMDSKYERFANKIKDYKPKEPEIKLPINGHELLDALNLDPKRDGKKIGQIMKQLQEKITMEPEITKEEVLFFCLKCS